MTDFRALCAEMANELDHYYIGIQGHDRSHPLAAEARAALAQPEPQGPTVMEIIALADEVEEEGLGQVDLVRRALTRWGRPAVEPVPVSEGLPEPEDCNAEGCCWAIGERGDWMCVHVLGRSWSNPVYTHWLPHWALPVPQQEAQP